MEIKKIAEVLQLSPQIKSLPAYREFAGAEEFELGLAVEAGVKAITEFRRKRYVEDYYRRLKAGPEYTLFTAEQLFKYSVEVRYPELFGEPITVDKFNRDILLYLSMYFTNDTRFPGSLEKGLMLMGNVGAGKSRIMQLFAVNQKQSYVIRSCKEITDRFFRIDNNEQDEYIQNYYGSVRTEDPKYYGQTELGICFDDLGTDDEKKHFGNPTNVMNEIVQARYNRFHELKTKTHFTTNLTGEELEELYGTRTRSRLREMCNAIIFHEESPDRRK